MLAGAESRQKETCLGSKVSVDSALVTQQSNFWCACLGRYLPLHKLSSLSHYHTLSSSTHNGSPSQKQQKLLSFRPKQYPDCSQLSANRIFYLNHTLESGVYFFFPSSGISK